MRPARAALEIAVAKCGWLAIFVAKSLITPMKRILIVLGLSVFAASSALAGGEACKSACAAKTACCASKQVAAKSGSCPVKATQQAKATAGSTKELGRATKAALLIASR
jgi:hypothetical protein